MICNVCGRKVASRKSEFRIYGINLGKFQSKVCRCGSVVFNEGSVDGISTALIQKSLLGLGSVVKVGKVGNSFVVRIHKKLANFLRLREGMEVSVCPADRNRVVVELPLFVDGHGYTGDIPAEEYTKDIQGVKGDI